MTWRELDVGDEWCQMGEGTRWLYFHRIPTGNEAQCSGWMDGAIAVLRREEKKVGQPKCGRARAKPIVPFREVAGSGHETGFPACQAMPRAPCFWWCREQAALQAKEG